MNIQAELQKSLYTGFVDSEEKGVEEYKPRLLVVEQHFKISSNCMLKFQGNTKLLHDICVATR